MILIDNPAFSRVKNYLEHKNGPAKNKTLENIKSRESPRKNFQVIVDFKKNEDTSHIDPKLLGKLPNYYHTAAHKYLGATLKSPKSSGAIRNPFNKNITKSEAILPLIHKTSQGIYYIY